MEKEEKAIELCKKYKQEKILKELQTNKNPKLIEQILTIDFEQIENCKKKIEKQEIYPKEKIEKISYIDGNKLSEEKRKHYAEIGSNVIEKGHYSVVTMAGGQRNKTWSFRTKRYLFNRGKAKTKIFI